MQPLISTLREMFTMNDLHFWGNLGLAFLYGIVFVFLAIRLLIRPAFRNFLTASMMIVFFILAVTFGVAAVSMKCWGNLKLEMVWFFLASIPPPVFLFSRRRSLLFGGRAAESLSAEHFNKLKDEFLTVASHELRTPLAVINGFAEILVREKVGPLNDEQKRRLRKILMQGQRLHHLIDDLLDLSRIRAGKLQVRQDIFDLIPVLKSAMDDQQILCEQQGIQLNDKMPDVLPDVVGDLERVTQVVINLLNNALKYTDGGGTISVTAFPEKDGEAVRVEIQDNGIGISAADQKRVFEEFFRADHQRARKYSGSGLGLAIVRQLIDAQGGIVGLESEGLGKGSKFYFTLPSAKSKRQPLTKVAVSPLPNSGFDPMKH